MSEAQASLQPANLSHLDHLNAAQLRRLLVERLTQQKLGLYWESDSLDRDRALNENVVLPRVVGELCYPQAASHLGFTPPPAHSRSTVPESDYRGR
jgi:hypothetical protein